MSYGGLKKKVKTELVDSDDQECDGNVDIFAGLHFILIEKGIGSKQANILKTQIEARGVHTRAFTHSIQAQIIIMHSNTQCYTCLHSLASFDYF